MLLLFELSGENPTLPLAELDCVGAVTDYRGQVAVAECQDIRSAERLSLTRTVCEYLGECSPDISEFEDLLAGLNLTSDVPFSGRVRKVHTGDTRAVDRCSVRAFERLIGTMIDGPVDLLHPETEYRAILSEDRCYFGRVLLRIDRGGYNHRNPGKRAFFHPGVMMPRMARALVNISCVRPGEHLLDPFCGTGGILIEAGLLQVDAIGSDFDPCMIQGSRTNLPGCTAFVADGTGIPLKSSCMDAVVTDFPYGQSVSIRCDGTMERLYDRALGEIRRVLKPGRRAVVVTHRDIAGIAGSHLEIVSRHEQRVHKSLTRQILVLRNG